MKRIPIEGEGGFQALVDDEDYPLLSRHKWYLNTNRTGFFTVHSSVNTQTVLMHCLIMGSKKGYQIRHIDGIGLNNQKANLEFKGRKFSDKSLPEFIIKKPKRERKPKSSAADPLKLALREIQKKSPRPSYRGVYKGGNCYLAKISINREVVLIGKFETAEDAARAYDEEARKIGRLEKLNFP